MSQSLTEADVAALFDEFDAVRHGHFRLTSGKHSDIYVQCALALQEPATASRLGQALAERLPERDVDVVASPALGGVLAGFVVAAALGVRFVFTERGPDRTMALRRGQHIAAGQRVLVVEDVVTTGGSALECAALCEEVGGKVVGIAALVDRSAAEAVERRPTSPPTALLHVDARTWDAQDCPLCRDGVPLDTPGSRHAP